MNQIELFLLVSQVLDSKIMTHVPCNINKNFWKWMSIKLNITHSSHKSSTLSIREKSRNISAYFSISNVLGLSEMLYNTRAWDYNFSFEIQSQKEKLDNHLYTHWIWNKVNADATWFKTFVCFTDFCIFENKMYIVLFPVNCFWYWMW